MPVVFNQQGCIIGVQERVELMLKPSSTPHALFELLFWLAWSLYFLVRAFFAFGVIDMRQMSNLFPATHGLENGHILIVGIVAMTELVENVTEGLLTLQALLVFALKGLQSIVMSYQRPVQS